MIYSPPNTSFEAIVEGFASGLVGTVGVRVRDNQGADTIARTTAGIAEDIAGSGIYRVTLTAPNTAGQYTVVWDTGGSNPRYATEELTISTSVFPSGVPTGSDLCALSDVRTALELPGTDTSRDPLISTLITQASKAIMNDTGREFAPATASATRRFRVDRFKVDLEPYDLRSATTVTLHPESSSPVVLSANTDYQLTPIGAPSGTYTSVKLSASLAAIGSSTTAFQFGYALLDIAGAWGFATVPVDVQRAAILTVSSWLRRDVMSFALSSDIELGRGLAPALPSGFAIPADARRLLQPFQRLRQWVS